MVTGEDTPLAEALRALDGRPLRVPAAESLGICLVVKGFRAAGPQQLGFMPAPADELQQAKELNRDVDRLSRSLLGFDLRRTGHRQISPTKTGVFIHYES